MSGYTEIPVRIIADTPGSDPVIIDDDGSGMTIVKRDPGSFDHWVPEVLESPVEALDMHLRHWEWMSTDDARSTMAGFLDAYKGGRHSSDALGMAGLMENVLDRATTTYVSPDVADLLYHQGQAMPPDMLQATDVPYPAGFMVLAKTWDYMDFNEDHYMERKIPVRAIAWWESSTIVHSDDYSGFKSGVMVALFADNDFAERLTPGVSDDFYRGAPPGLFMVDLWAWSYDTWWKDLDDPAAEPDHHHASIHVGEMRRCLLTAWRFMQEEIVRTERFRPPRPATRRWNRANIANIPEDGCITSVHLRRYAQKHNASDDEEREAREVCWSHRWWVKGHWRKNRVTGEKDVWVRPYIKGPEDAPLVLKERLVEVSR